MTTENALVQLVTRVPYDLRRRAKIHCVSTDTTLAQFVIDAIQEQLQSAKQESRRSGRRAASR
jgi:hypothetical protein